MADEELDLEALRNLPPEEYDQLMKAAEAAGMGYPQQEEKANIFTLFKKFFESKESTKIGNLSEEELYAVRILKNAALFADTLGYFVINKYLNLKAENILATSMSKNFAFVNAVQTQKRFLETGSKEGGGKKAWGVFKPKQPEQQA